MLKREDIERFYRDVENLSLKFPVAELARQTGHSKANVSKYLNRKLEPSESFLNAFNAKFQKSVKNVSRETGMETGIDYANLKSELIASLKRENAMLREKNSNSTGLIERIESLAAMQILTMDAIVVMAQALGKKDVYNKTVEISKKMVLKDSSAEKGN